MNKIVLVIIGYLFFSCESTKHLQEVISDKYVTISLKEEFQRDSLKLNIPTEFQISINPKKTIHTTFYYIRNGEGVGSDENYLIYNGDTNKYIYKKGQWEDGSYYPKSIYLMEGAVYVEKGFAQFLLTKYNNKASLEGLKKHLDTIKLVPYSQFRKDFPAFIEEMRKEPDSLQISIRFKSGKRVFVSERINW